LHKRLKPEIVAPDGGNTSFFIADLLNPLLPAQGEPDGFPNFFGTSAAAPHAAAVAASMLDQRARDIAAGKRFFIGPRRLTPAFIYQTMQATARDLTRRSSADDSVSTVIERGRNFDFDSGFGLLDAEQALRATRGF
jgi:subtilisin family serine protease